MRLTTLHSSSLLLSEWSRMPRVMGRKPFLFRNYMGQMWYFILYSDTWHTLLSYGRGWYLNTIPDGLCLNGNRMPRVYVTSLSHPINYQQECSVDMFTDDDDKIKLDTPQLKDPYQQRAEITQRLLWRLVDALRYNPFEVSRPEDGTLWQCFTPAEYLSHHGKEYGEQSLKLMEAQAITALIKGELADGLFMAATLSISNEYQFQR